MATDMYMYMYMQSAAATTPSAKASQLDQDRLLDVWVALDDVEAGQLVDDVEAAHLVGPAV